MRLWHKCLIPVLPKQQLLGQWRECCLIAKNITEKGAPNHMLVDPIMDYPIGHFVSYAKLTMREMLKRGYKVDPSAFTKYFENYDKKLVSDVTESQLFREWHNNRYLHQCYRNLQEKYDRGGITDEEWKTIANYVRRNYTLTGFLERMTEL